jgi:Zn-dependent protease
MTGGMISIVVQVALAAIPVILAITLHEASHGYAALAMGDDTAKRAGRLSLNPLRHVDRVGTILLPGFLLIFQLLLPPHQVRFMFGWAKPVPVSAARFRDPRRGMMIVAAAGPAMNFLLAWLGTLLLPHPTIPTPGVEAYLDAILAQHPIVGTFLFYFILSNLVLGLFNLIPIPPLDGGRIAVGLLPLPWARGWARLERAGIIIILLIVFLLPGFLSDVFGIHFDPFRAVLGTVIPWAIETMMHLSGHHFGAMHEQFL